MKSRTRPTNPFLRAMTAATLILICLHVHICAAQSATDPDNERCDRCHGQTWIAQRSPEALAAMVRAPAGGERVLRSASDVPRLYVPREDLSDSAHGQLACDQCHPGIEVLPHAQKVTTLSCQQCHAAENHELAGGRHAPSTPGAPTCISCHGDAHEVAPVAAARNFEQAVAMVERCSACHNELGKHDFSPAQSFHDSIHGDALYKKGLVQGPLCTDCHGTHTILPPSAPDSPVNPANAPQTCGKCHQGVAATYAGSIHGTNLAAGMENAASCTSCHHSHGIAMVGPEFMRDVTNECSHCHLKLGESYLLSFHGKATQLGSSEFAVCSSCHGAHDILPASNPKSRVAPENLKETCGQCHKGVNDRFVQYITHVDYSSRGSHPAVFYTFWGMTILLCSVLAVFIPHSLLWFQRTLADRIRSPRNNGAKLRMVRRFNRVHRITHGLIIISFMGLVATGFPIKYSHAEWAQNISAALGGVGAMRILHRIFAVITFGYAGLHLSFLAYFFWKKCPRPRWRYIIGPESMMFSLKDLKDFVAMIKWFFRRGPNPRFGRWTYFEKFDYWGEIWGVILIGGSGLLLWMPELFTRWLPGWILNCAMVVHSIEALLAASVIFLVHFFNTHLRPEKFPIDMTMWSGQISEDELKHERPAEYERLVQSNQLDAHVVEPMPLRLRILGAVLGIAAFLFGIFLIILAIRTELLKWIH